MGNDAQSLGQIAFRHAVRRTANAYRKHIEGFGGQVVVTFFTLLITASLNGGLEAVLTDLSTLGIVALANIGWVLILFAWHLWLAPYELVLEEIGRIQNPLPPTPAPPSRPEKYQVNFKALKNKSIWTLSDLAGVLASKDESDGSPSSKYIAWMSTVEDAAESYALKYTRVRSEYIGRDWEHPGGSSKVKREDAIAWAESIGVPMDEVR